MKKLILIMVVIGSFIGCSNTSKKPQKLVFKEDMVEITIDSVDIKRLPEDSEIIFKLWGYDTQVADVKATLLNEYKYKLTELPVTYGLNYKKEWKEKIKPGQSGKYGYFITLEVKTKDDKVYKIDYEATDKDYFGVPKENVDDLEGRIFIKEAK